MRKKKGRRNIFSVLFSSMDFVRRLVLNLVFWTVVVLAVIAFFPPVFTVPDESVLRLQPAGIIVERNDGSEIPDWVREFTSSPLESSLLTISRTIRTAADDRRITALYLDLSSIQYASLASLQELEGDLQYFKSRGKKIIAWSPYYNLYGAYLASAADHVYIDPMGMVHLPGYSVYRTYMGDALDEWMIDVSYFHAGEFKSYGDGYVSSSMSPAMKEENLRWLNSLWDQYVGKMSENRGLAEGDLSRWIDTYASLISDEGLSEAEAAVRGNLVDALMTEEELDRELVKLCGVKTADMVQDYDYISQIGSSYMPGEKRVVVLTASGTIHSGESSASSIGSATLCSILDSIASDRSTGAIVLRLDTGGGSAFASEQIRRKLTEIRRQGIRIVASMGGVTASGGYWITTAADEVWTAPGTITGSIGVFSIIPRINRLAEEKFGLRSDGVGTTWMGGQERLDQPLNYRSRSVYQSSVDQTYNQFLSLVSESRGMNPEDLKPLAEGRIWSGREAVAVGLADAEGTLGDAVEAAVRLAGLDDYSIEYYREAPVRPGDIMSSIRSGGITGGVDFLFSMTGTSELFSFEPGRVYALSFLNEW